jgi:NADH-quinone oxidoreductase subunit A
LGGVVTASAATVVLWPAVVYAVLAVIIVIGILVVSYVLGPRHAEGKTGVQYESGVEPAGPLPRRLSVEFYQVAIFFVVFDLEAVFILAWAVQARRLSWTGYAEIVVFIAVLFAGLVYLWKVGGLDWGPAGHRRRLRREGRE